MRWTKGAAQAVCIHGKLMADRSTKKLAQRIPPRHIAVIHHNDLDEPAVLGLLAARVKAVINTGETMTGRIASKAALKLLDAGIPLLETDAEAFDVLAGAVKARLTDSSIDTGSAWIPCRCFGRSAWLERFRAARASEAAVLERFVDNTLDYANREKEWITEPFPELRLVLPLAGRPAVVVVRGNGCRDDLDALAEYIHTTNPVLIGVDGGADALRDAGWRPDLIVGDMDSVSDAALRCHAELVVHGYRDGHAPGLRRISELGLNAKLLPLPGTSEDAALLLAYENGCEPIVAIGIHSSMQDYVEKGRMGMASSWLVRMKISSKLVDAKGLGLIIHPPKKKTSVPSARALIASWVRSDWT